MKYAGRSFTLAAGQRIDHINEAAKNHLINAWSPRGLVALGYADHGHETEIGEGAKKTNLEFKRTQVRRYNEQNEQRKMSRMGFLPAPKKVKEYAVELGIQLLEPYTLKDEEKAAIATTSLENEKLKIQLAETNRQLAEMQEMMKQFMAGQEPRPERPKERPGWKATNQKQ
jgi:hypothetical protein